MPKPIKFSNKSGEEDRLLKFLRKTSSYFFPSLASYGPLKQYLNRLVTKGNIIYLKKDKRIIGMVGYFDYDERYKSAYIMTLITDKEFRGRGYGKILLKECLKDYRKKKIKKIRLTVASTNKAAISLYDKYRFKTIKIKKNDRGKGIHTLILELGL